MGTTINKYIYLSLNSLSRFFDYKIKINYSKSEYVQHIDEIRHPCIKACLRRFNIQNGLDIHIAADLPAKTGLGSSSAFTVGLLKALFFLQKKEPDKESLLREALYLEQKVLKEKVGSQDQVHACYGGLNLIRFVEDEVIVKPVILPEERKLFLQNRLLLFYTGIRRFAEDILEEQIQKTQTRQNDKLLGRMYEMVFEAEESLRNDPLEKMVVKWGELLQEGWELKKNLSSKVSGPEIDRMYEKALQNGALGGKLCGAGHGGFLLLLVPEENHKRVRKALQELTEVEFAFEDRGSSLIYTE